MAEVLTELVAKITADATELKRTLGESETSIKSWAERNKQQFKAVGLAFAGIGAGITASLGMMTKAAVDEEISINRLGIALKNVGINYDDVKASLEGVIKATQRKTSVSDDAQRDALARLLLVTNDYSKALSLLPLTLDLAAAGQMDASTAATYLGKALIELEGGAAKVNIRLGRASIEFSTLGELMERVKGAAAATANPLVIIGNEFRDIAEQLGTALLPALKNFKEALLPILDRIGEWINKNPALVTQILLFSAAAGGLALAVAPLLIFLPSVVASFSLMAKTFTVLVPAMWGFVAAHAALLAEVMALGIGFALIAYGIAAVMRAAKGEKLEGNIFSQMKKDLESLKGMIKDFVSGLISADEKTGDVAEGWGDITTGINNANKALKTSLDLVSLYSSLFPGLHQLETGEWEFFAPSGGPMGYTPAKVQPYPGFAPPEGMKLPQFRDSGDVTISLDGEILGRLVSKRLGQSVLQRGHYEGNQ